MNDDANVFETIGHVTLGVQSLHFILDESKQGQVEKVLSNGKDCIVIPSLGVKVNLFIVVKSVKNVSDN